MKKYLWAGVIVIVVVIVWIFVGTRKSTPIGGITFGLIAGMTGDYAVVGESFSKGAELAQGEWNSVHPNQQIKMVVENDGFDAKKGLSAYRKLTSIDHVDALINMTTITIDAIYGNVVASGIPVALGFEQGIDAKDDNVIQLWPGTVPGEVELGKYVKEKGFKNLVVFVDNGSISFERFADGFIQGYGSTVHKIKVSTDGSDTNSNALEAVSYKPDAIVFISQPTSSSLLIKVINTLSKVRPQFVFDANIQAGFDGYKKILGDMNILNGSIIYTVPNVYRAEFNDSFKKKYASEPAIGSETGYNAFMLLAQTYNLNKSQWVSNMKQASFTGADGKIVFDENGVRIPELKIGVIADGKLPN